MVGKEKPRPSHGGPIWGVQSTLRESRVRISLLITVGRRLGEDEGEADYRRARRMRTGFKTGCGLDAEA